MYLFQVVDITEAPKFVEVKFTCMEGIDAHKLKKLLEKEYKDRMYAVFMKWRNS